MKFKGITGKEGGLDSSSFIIGRHDMTCCVEDIAFKGIVCLTEGAHYIKNRDWITLTAKISMEQHPAYGNKKGPVLHFVEKSAAEKPLQEVATFY